MLPRPRDIEEGMPREERRVNDRNRRSFFSNQCLCGLALLLLFLRYPLITVLVLFSLLVCLTSCLRLFVRYSRYLLGDDAVTEFWTQMNVFRLPADVNIANLRLALMDRDFTANDYDMLLALDDDTGSTRAGRQVTEAEMASLQVVVYEAKPGKEETCSVCLETFQNGDRLRRLQCRHAFHEGCITTWMKQKGPATTCPICKKRVLLNAE